MKRKCRLFVFSFIICCMVMAVTASADPIKFKEKAAKVPVGGAFVLHYSGGTNVHVVITQDINKANVVSFNDNYAIIQTKQSGACKIHVRSNTRYAKTYYFTLNIYEPKTLPKKITLINGTTYTFAAGKDAKVKSSASKIVSVSKSKNKKNVVFKAKAKGKSVIKVKSKGKTYTCTVTVVNKGKVDTRSYFEKTRDNLIQKYGEDYLRRQYPYLFKDEAQG